MPVLAATLTTIVVFFPVTFLFGVSRFLFGALAIAVVLALLASYVVALSVIPLLCARFLGPRPSGGPSRGGAAAEIRRVAEGAVASLSGAYGRGVRRTLDRPLLALAVLAVLFVARLPLYPHLRVAFFP